MTRFGWIGARELPFTGCCNEAMRTELDRGRGPLMEKCMSVLAATLTLLLLLLLLLLSSRLLQL